MKASHWISDLLMRLERLQKLASESAKGIEGVKVWMGGLFQPGAFLTATRQWAARKMSIALESLRLTVQVGAGSSGGSSFLVEGTVLYGATVEKDSGVLAIGGVEGTHLGTLTFCWVHQDQQDLGNQSSAEIPIYITKERGEVFASVELKSSPDTIYSWYEFGASIALWEEQ